MGRRFEKLRRTFARRQREGKGLWGSWIIHCPSFYAPTLLASLFMVLDYRLPPALARAANAKILIHGGLGAALLVLALSARAQSASPVTSGQASLLERAPQKTWAYLYGDTLSGHADQEVELQGNAQLLRSDTRIYADLLRYDQRTERMQAQGNVRIQRSDRIYTGTYLDMDVERFEGFFTDITYQLGGTSGHGDALRADFTDKNHMTAHKGTYTTCRRKPGPDWVPEWVLTATQLHIDNEEEIGRAQGAYLHFQGVPVLPVPPFSFPISEKRRSGFLPPLFGLDSANGFELATPYYFNLAPNYDLTVTPNFMSNRGVNIENQFRYMEPRYSGDLKLAYMPGDLLRGQDRVALALTHSSQLASPIGNIAIAANISRAGDANYWADFITSTILQTGAPLGGTNRQLPADLTASWGRGDLSSMLKVQKWQGLQIITPYDRVPQWTLRYAQSNVQGIDWSVDTDLTQFEGDRTLTLQPNAQRAFAWAQVSYPMIWPAFYLTPKLQTHLAAYQFDAPINKQQSANNVISTLSLDAGLTFERNTEILGVQVLQTLEPRAFYVYTPFTDQSILPNYDTAAQDLNLTAVFTENAYVGHDKISDNNLLTLGLTTRFLNPDTGAQFASFGLAQRLRFEEQKVTLLPGQTPAATGLSDILLGSRLNLGDRWVLDAATQYNIQTQQSIRSVIGGRFHAGDFQTLNLAYRSQANSSEQVDLSWQWPLNRLWSMVGGAADADAGRFYGLGRLAYSLRDQKLADSLFGLEYDAGCWIARGVYSRTPLTPQTETSKLMFQIELVGFTRLGIDPFKTLTDSIPRYQYLR
jgi:LPS-assembly protein